MSSTETLGRKGNKTHKMLTQVGRQGGRREEHTGRAAELVRFQFSS